MSTLKKVLLGVILLTAVAVSGVHFFDLPHIAKAETNAAPPFTVTDMNGQTVSLASLKGKPVFLNFWAPKRSEFLRFYLYFCHVIQNFVCFYFATLR